MLCYTYIACILVIETDCVYRAVGAASLNVIQFDFSL